MKLKIVSTEGTLYEWEITEIIVPTKDWEVGILPDHALYAWIIKWGLCKFKPIEFKWDFLREWDYIVISVWDGIVYTDWKIVSLAVSSANAKIELSEEELQKMKENLEKEIEEIKAKGSIEDIEKVLLQMNKILADIELIKLKKIKSPQ